MSVRNLKIVVTGAQGFIGTNLLLRIRSIWPNADLIGIDSLASKSANKRFTEDFTDHHEIDLMDPRVGPLIAGSNLVIHLAAEGNVIDSIADPLSNFRSNVASTLSLLEAMRKEGCPRIVFSSTGGAIMGNTRPPVNECTLPKPISPYGASKLACEGYLQSYASSYNFNVTILRFGNVYGEFSLHKKGVINSWIKSSIAGAHITIFGDGSSTRDYIHVKDLCDGIISAAQQNIRASSLGNSKIYHLACSKETSLNELARYIGEASSKDLRIILQPSRSGEVDRNFAECDLAAKELNFMPKIDIVEGIKSLYAWLESNKNEAYTK